MSRSHADRVTTALVRRVVAISPIPFAGVVLGTVLIVAIHWTTVPHALLSAWAAAVALAVLIRLAATLAMRQRLAQGLPVTRRGTLPFALSFLLTGCAWGVGGMMVWRSGPMAMVVTITGFQAMVMGAASTLSPFMPAFWAFSVPAMMPMVAVLAAHGDFTGMVLALYNLIFFLLMIGIAWRFQASLSRTLELGFEKEDLIEELTLAHRAAAAAARAKSQFLAIMSHEIRTPMSGVIGMARLMLDGALDAVARERAETICQSAQSLLAILDDILDFSKLEAGKVTVERVPFDLPQVIDGVVGLMRPRAEDKGLRLSARVSAAVPRHVRSDPTRLRQILFNLVGNAIKFTERGTVVVTVETVSGGAGGEWLRLSVIDSGIGIAPDALAGLFTEFSQGDGSIARRFGGTGLGLVICRRLVELLEGTIDVDSAPGRGSVFRVTLPLVAADRAEMAAVQAPAPSVALPSLSILLVEDNPINQKVALGYLARDGHRVTLAGNGHEALALAAQGGFDLVLMDMQMPEMDGLDATRRIRALPAPLGTVPILALTANAMSGDAERCRVAGMNGHVAKPIEPRALALAMATILSQDAPSMR